MIESKQLLLAAYTLLLFIALGLPFISSFRGKQLIENDKSGALFGFALIIASSTFLLPNWIPLKLTSSLLSSVVFIAFLLPQGLWTMVGGFAALPLMAATTWWMPNPAFDPLRLCLFLALGVFASALCRLQKPLGIPRIWGMTIVLVLGITANLFTGPLHSPNGFGAMWHHWGVYIATSQNLLAGGIPFSDFPVQYGFGPMLFMAGSCYLDCWTGGYLIVFISNIAFLLAMGSTSIILLRKTARGLALCAFIALTCSILLWTTFPPNLLGMLGTPSTGGTRFLPIALVLLFIVRRDAVGGRATLRNDLLGHFLWLFGVYWSPEAAFFTTSVWWPYLALRDIHNKSIQGFWPVIRLIVIWASKAFCALVFAVFIFAVLFRMFFAEWPSLSGYLTYIRNPPGIVPVNIHGPIWILLSAILLGFIAVIRSDLNQKRTTAACLLALISVSSYYLGRSHDNNILNLFPFLALLLIAAVQGKIPDACKGFATVFFVGTIAWVATFGLEDWFFALRTGTADDVGVTEIFERMDVVQPSSWPHIKASAQAYSLNEPPISEVGKAIGELLRKDDGTPIWINKMMVIPRLSVAHPWTGMTNTASYAVLPTSVIEGFIERGAKRFQRAGWILINREDPSFWLDRFKIAYDIAEERSFGGGYVAYRLVPR